MPSIRRLVLRLRAVVAHRALEHDMQEEMRAHLAQATERLVARGMSEAEARLAARREFGNVTVLQEEGRDARGARWIDALRGDLSFAFRYFAHRKATTAIIVAVLALSTGANTLFVSIFQAQFLRAAPDVSDDASRVRIWSRERPTRTAAWSTRDATLPEVTMLAERRDIFRDVAGWTKDDVVLNGGDSTGARGVGAQFVTSNFFNTLDVKPFAGTWLRPDVSGTPARSAVMSYVMAEELYGSAAAAVGRRVIVNEIAIDIVGVASPRFQGAARNMGQPALWIPISARADIERVPARWAIDEPAIAVFARLAPGVSRDQATAFAAQVVRNALPDSAARVGMARDASVLGMNAPPPGPATEEELLVAALIMAIGIIILLVGWMNVSSLMVAAAVARRHEIAVRLSLGASRARLLRQLVTESTLLAITGSTLGLIAAWCELTYMMKSEIDGVDLSPDIGTFAFVLAMALITGVLFGLSPALHATRGGVANALRDSGAGASTRSGLQRGFVVAQIALSQPLLVLLGTLLALVVAGYTPLAPEMSERVIAMSLRPLQTGGAPAQRADAVDSLVPRIAVRAEVVAAALDADEFEIRNAYPIDRGNGAAPDTAGRIVHLEGAAPGWLPLVDVPLLFGRDVALADTTAESYPVVIGSDFAHRLWGSTNPIGRRLASPTIPEWKQDSITMTVVGVYDATRRLPGAKWQGSATADVAPVRVFTAHGKHWRHDRMLVRTRGPALSFVPDLQRFVRAIAPSLPVTAVMTLAQEDERAYTDTLRMSALVGVGGALALLLASLGLYGVVSLAVRQRTREIGIRIAVGAEPMRVARMFLGSGVRVSALALAIGMPLSVAALKIGISRGLVLAPGVNPYVVGACIAPVLIAVAAAATWIPARRAALVDPASTLRVE